ncbi:MAG: tRNA 2-thiouridine(34) synthase MnmA [Alphaproteobacteria bacterium]|nr:tRNA 2-thiouridine(34) synthase MnmA [Alphaproteobacteria bacterium]
MIHADDIRALMNLPGEPGRTRVVAAMSGGVDSAVAAALVQRAGYDVVGITLQLYASDGQPKRKGSCCAGQDIYDARSAAQTLGIAHYVLDYTERFRKSVMEDFAATYARGETPIPCVRCNETVKFRDLLNAAKDVGAQALVTGHYIQRVNGPSGPELRRAQDVSRDQSYFLFATTKAQLDFIRFPLGGLPKSETRAIATELGLELAGKPDSQDICFVPNGRYSDIVQRLRPGAIEPGDIVDQSGRVLGPHDGVINFTVGQRKGLGLGHHESLFVIRIDAEKRQVVVGPREALATRRIFLRDMNWLDGAALGGSPRSVLARVRSTREPVRAEIVATAEGAEVELLAHEEGVAPGQACVLYDAADASRMLGGGWIVKGEAAAAA